MHTFKLFKGVFAVVALAASVLANPVFSSFTANQVSAQAAPHSCFPANEQDYDRFRVRPPNIQVQTDV